MVLEIEASFNPENKGEEGMKHKFTPLLIIVLMFLIWTAIAMSDTNEEISLSRVPKKVLEAAQKAVPGIKLTEAEIEVYELEGTLNGKEYEIEVTSDGEVLEVEVEGDAEDDEDKDDHEDHDDDDHHEKNDDD
jgi:uncharacterized membrane protein YkoI